MGTPFVNLTDVLKGSPDAPAIFVAGGGPRLSRGQLNEQISYLANVLRKSGIRPGDVVSLADVNTVEFAVAFLGTTYARAVAAPLNPNYKLEEFKFFMEDAQSKLLLVPARGNREAEEAAASLNIPIVAVSVYWSNGKLHTVFESKTPSFVPKTSGVSSALEESPVGQDVGLFLHTSGTTSRPKGVPLSHANLVASISNIIGTYEMVPSDRSLLVMPLFHVHGLMAGFLAPLAAGAAIILPASGGFSATTFWRDATEHAATFYTAVPTIHQILLARVETDYPKSAPPPLRFIRSCSSSLAPATLHKVEAAFGVPVLEAYAMTEASHQMTSNPLPKHGPHKAGTVGRAQGAVQVAILDGQNQAVPTGTVGEVCIRGPNVTKGYLNNPKANEEAYAGGWFHTGDQGFLDADGFVTLVGRIKELINRGGEKISPIEVDSALLSHPNVSEAVAFAAPDEKYGEAVAAAVVLNKPVADPQAFIAELKKFTASKVAKFKVPELIFITDKLPKNATGKIQRRFMVDAFMKSPQPQQAVATNPTAASSSGGSTNGYTLAAEALARMGVKLMYGVIGIPVTELASAAQAAGIRYIGFRNEQSAGYAAAAAGYLTGNPAALITVSGPGAVHGIAGLSHAAVNCFPLVMISGSAEQSEIGKGSFQELDQVAAVQQFCKYAGKATTPRDIAAVVAAAVKAAGTGKPGAAYVDIPSDVLMANVPASLLETATKLSPPRLTLPTAPSSAISQALALLQSAQRPLVVIGKGAAMSRGEKQIRALVESAGIPFLGTAMGRGVAADSSALNVNAARSMALAKADVALVIGARLNWQLHFGEPPKWGAGVKFILVDIAPTERDAGKAAVALVGDAGAVAGQLAAGLARAPLNRGAVKAWASELATRAAASKARMEARLQKEAFPLDFTTALRVIRDACAALPIAPVVVSEGANTMDNARVILEPVDEPRLRLDAGTWGTMGVGLGYAIAAATACPERLVLAVEGDSAFGFSGMELETIARYGLGVVVIIFNNNGIYGGDRREDTVREAASKGASGAGFAADPIPTAFVEDIRYHMIMQAFGADGYSVDSASQLAAACRTAFAAKKPAVINIVIDPFAGVESGNVHAFNAPKANM